MKSVLSLARGGAQFALKESAAAFDRVVRPKAGPVVLIYHRVGRATAMEVDLPVSLFDEQMQALSESRRIMGLGAALATGAPLADGDPIVVTFDDGTRDFVEIALPIMVKHNISSLLYVATDFVDTQRAFPDGGAAVSWSALRDALSTGLVEIGSHTHTHALLDRLEAAQVCDELDRSIDRIGTELNVVAQHFAYPKALLGSEQAQNAVRSRFQTAAIAGTRPNPYGSIDPYRVLRSPIQFADSMAGFQRKAHGGMRLEDDARRWVNRVRYRTASA